jgi:hypothetical protein
MYCKKCGKQIPDNSAFCPKCGASQGGDNVLASPETRWETCEIYACCHHKEGFLLPTSFVQFFASGLGPKGKYTVAESRPFAYNSRIGGGDCSKEGDSVVLSYTNNEKENKAARDSFDDFVAELHAKGWDSLGRFGEHWYSVRFRRQSR